MDKRHSELIYDGAAYQIYAVVEDGKCPAKDFIGSLKGSAYNGIMALIKRAGDHGPPNNEQKFKKLNDEKLYEFKDYQTRIFCDYDKGKRIVLTHGYIKKKNKTDKGQIKRAYELLEHYRKG